VKPDAFAEDLARKPETLARLALALTERNPWASVVPGDTERVVLLGMGSSAYAGAVAAARLRARGVVATAELASSPLLPDWGPGTLVIAVSAGGASAETLDALDRLPAGVHTIALTNTAGAPLTQRCDETVTLDAGIEHGGVACRSYQHTLALLLALEYHLVGADSSAVAASVDGAAAATSHLLTHESDWLPAVSDMLLGPTGTCLAAPAHRLCSAQQGALMLREGPRRPAVAYETGDWSHVEVYLTKTTDYRLLVFTGSAWEPQMAEWTTARGSTVVAVGGEMPGARYVLRYPGDTDDDDALLTEVLVAELVAARQWQRLSRESGG